MTVETTENVDIFAMPDDAFANYTNNSTVTQEESTLVDSATLGEDSFRDLEEGGELNNELDKVDESDEFIEVEGIDEPIDDDSNADTSEHVTETDNDNGDEETADTTDEVVFDKVEAFSKLFAEPIKANGKEYKVDSVEDAIKLMQMGMGYYNNMTALKPKRALLAMLEQNDINEEKLNYAIDLLNKNPQAINKLISDQDLSEIVDDKNATYTPNNYRVNEQQLNVRDALAEIENTPTYTRTVNVLGKEWDATSRGIVQENPHLIATINSHMGNGMFDSIIAEVDKRIMLGSIPYGTPMLHAYKMVGDEMYATDGSRNAPNGQQNVVPQANAKPPIRKPSEQVKQSKLAASKPRANATQRQTKQMDDVFAMTDEAFNKKYGFN